MNAIESWLLMLLQKIRSTYVCRQHAFFDETMSVIALHRKNTLDFTLIVENHLGFDGFKIDCAPLLAGFQ